MGVFTTGSTERSVRDTPEPGHELRSNLGAQGLIAFGVSRGGGIFVPTVRAAALHVGPASRSPSSGPVSPAPAAVTRRRTRR